MNRDRLRLAGITAVCSMVCVYGIKKMSEIIGPCSTKTACEALFFDGALWGTVAAIFFGIATWHGLQLCPQSWWQEHEG